MIQHVRTMSPQRQLGFAALVMLMLVVMLVSAWLWLRAPFKPLFTQLRTADAATIVDELDHKKTPYRLADNGTTILVPADRIDATRLSLMNGNLALKGTVGFELFNKSDMGLTDFAQRINYQRALQGELERTIMSLDGIEESRVHLSLGEDRIFREDRVAPKASVTIRMRAGAPLAPAAAAGIQRLVAASVPQLEASDVVIVNEIGQAISVSAAAPVTAPEALEQSAIGSYYEARVREALQHAYLADHVGVQVRAGLSRSSSNISHTESDWNPAARDFPLQVTLDVPATLDPNSRQDIQGLAAGAVSFNASLGDAISFGSIAANASMPLAAPPQAASMSAPASDLPAATNSAAVRMTISSLAWPALALLAILVMASIIVARRRDGRPLSASERARVAIRLRTLLNAEESDAAHS